MISDILSNVEQFYSVRKISSVIAVLGRILCQRLAVGAFMFYLSPRKAFINARRRRHHHHHHLCRPLLSALEIPTAPAHCVRYDFFTIVIRRAKILQIFVRGCTAARLY